MTEDDLIGKQLDEYRLEALLGQGGMARVYHAVDVRLKRRSAVKVIDIRFREDADYAVRFEREAQAIALLDHPHIVRLYRYGEAHGVLYMAMQYIEGADLAFVLRSYRQDGEFIEPKDASRIINEICQALDYAHDQGVIHRDVKPSNILLDKEGRAILNDFGLVLLTAIGTRGEIFGSARYMSPEQAVSSRNVTPQSDLYSVGVILYEMFTNQLPFMARNPTDIALMHINKRPPPPCELRPGLSQEVQAVILKALAKKPYERYQTGAELAEDLERVLGAGPGT
jgi:serine/threonine protein kinase